MANKFGYFLIGSLVGAVATLLAAPRVGEQTRAKVAERANAVVGDAREWGTQASAGVQNIYQQVAAKSAEVMSGVAAKGQAAAEGAQCATCTTAPQAVDRTDELREKIEAARQRIAAQVAKNAERAAAAEEAIAAEAVVVEAEAAPIEEPAAEVAEVIDVAEAGEES